MTCYSFFCACASYSWFS